MTRPIGYWTAVSTVVANIVGAGVFTALGFQLLELRDPAALLLLWLVGGIVALAGALSYSEVAQAIPRSGGERTYLAELWHPLAGITAGWVSVTVGFAAPIALAAMALGRFAEVAVHLPARATGIGVIALLTLLHALAPGVGRRMQVGVTLVKVLLVLVFIGLAVAAGNRTGVSFVPTAATMPSALSPAFAVSLIYVGYAYTGWNAATYFSGEVEGARHVVPRALVHGTLLVTTLYVLLHWSFLRVAPISVMVGQVEVGAIAAESMLGKEGGRLMAGALAVLLLSTISAMCLAGPRALEETLGGLPWVGRLVERIDPERPVGASLLLGTLAVLFVAADAFETTLAFSGAVLTLCSMATVAGVYRLRQREGRSLLGGKQGMRGFLAPPVYLLASAWTLWHLLRERPFASLAAIAVVIGLGALSLALRHPKTVIA